MTSNDKASSRPLSPHIGIWRWPVTMASSILHRMTGVGNSIGLILLTWWLVALATGPGAYAQFSGFIGSPLGRLFLFGFTVSLTYHLLNGVRHLVWDSGRGYDVEGSARATWIIMILAIVLSAAVFAVGYFMKGAM